MPHRIRRLTFRVKATSPEEALALRKELRVRMDPALLATFERTFDEVAATDEVVHLPRLELRLSISGVEDVAASLPERMRVELRQQLSAALAGAARAGASSPRGPGVAGHPATGPGHLGGATPSGGERRSGPAGTQGGSAPVDRWADGPWANEPSASGALPAAGAEARAGVVAALPAGGDAGAVGASDAAPFALLRMLIPYLRTGSLPWPLANLDRAAVLWHLRGAASDDPAAVLEQAQREPGDPRREVAFWFRWLQLVPEARWAAVARAIDARPSGGPSAALAEIVDALSGHEAASMPRATRLQLAAAAVAAVGAGSDGLDAGELASELLRAFGGGHSAGGNAAAGGGGDPPADGGDAADRRAGGPEALGGSLERRVRAAAQLTERLPEPARAAFLSWLAAGRRAGDVPPLSRSPVPPAGTPSAPGHAAPARAPLRGEQPAWPGGPSTDRSKDIAPARRDEASPPRSGSDRERERDPEPPGQWVSHAGLLLLHPYLPRFFESTGVKEAGRPELAPARLPRAAALLHLLATGEDEAFELELGFIKIALGLELDSPLPISEGLFSAGDREEVDALLSAVLEHWSALKRTSVRGLRGSFLQRRGLVREDPRGFRLQVEPAPFDMLLGQLPWGIGVVKLPWMKRAIFTDWPLP
ncbi:contractile injection system tape measure protein [Sorangium sp. So ce385]|uniref:contractile injection system tape measure protein n=1 Tax=Sorangium sp. So ce385 TaxID=3133308 RepID=UPI003F5C5F63